MRDVWYRLFHLTTNRKLKIIKIGGRNGGKEKSYLLFPAGVPLCISRCRLSIIKDSAVHNQPHAFACPSHAPGCWPIRGAWLVTWRESVTRTGDCHQNYRWVSEALTRRNYVRINKAECTRISFVSLFRGPYLPLFSCTLLISVVSMGYLNRIRSLSACKKHIPNFSVETEENLNKMSGLEHWN
jgi:hypothetical protein